MKSREGLWMRCLRLGGEVPFVYCLQEAGDLPCHRIVFCWQALFPVEEYLKKTLSPQNWERFASGKPKEKISHLIELIEQAKNSIN